MYKIIYVLFTAFSLLACSEDTPEMKLECDREAGFFGVATIQGGETACSFMELRTYRVTTGSIGEEQYERITIEASTPASSYIASFQNAEEIQGQNGILLRGLGLFQKETVYSGSAKSRTFSQPANIVFTKIDRENGLMSGVITGRIIASVDDEGVSSFGTVEITFEDLDFSNFQ